MTRTELGALAAILAVLALTLRPHVDLTSGDFSYFLQTESLADLRFDVPVPAGASALPLDMAIKDGKLYSHYPPGTALLLVPFFRLGSALDRATGGLLGAQSLGGWRVERLPLLAMQLANLLFMAAIFLLMRRLAAFFALSAGAYLASVVLLVFAAPFWNQSNHVSSHLPATLLVLGASVLVVEGRSTALAGLLAGLAVVVRPADAVLAVILAVYAARRRGAAALAAFAAPAAIGVTLLLAYNAAVFGTAFESGYQYDTHFGRGGFQRPALASAEGSFSTPLARGLAGLLAGAMSPQSPLASEVRGVTWPKPELPWDQVRGLLVVMPVILFAPAGLRRLWREGKRDEAVVVAASFAALLLLYSKWSFWFANGHTPLASRFLCEAYPGICLAIAAYGERAEGMALALVRFAAAWSIANQVFFVATIYLHHLAGVDLAAAATWKVALGLAATSAAAVWVAGSRTRASLTTS